MMSGNNNSTKKPKSIFKLSIRTVLISVLLIQLLVVASSIAYLSHKNNTKTTGVLVSNTILELNARIEQQLTSYFERPIDINNMNEQLIRNHLLDIHSQKTLLRQFSIQIKSNRSVNSIYFGNDAGGIANAGIDKSKNRFYNIYTKDFRCGEFYKYAINDDFETSNLMAKIPYFDSRLRPWYINAQKQSGVVWSDVYINSTGTDLGVTASKAVKDDANRLLGVVGVDLFLSDISEFLSNLNLGIGGQSFIINKSGYLIASSMNSSLFKRDGENHSLTRIKATESESELIRIVSNALLSKYKDVNQIEHDSDFSITVQGCTYLVHFKPFSLIPSNQWIIVTTIPAITYLSQVFASNRITYYLIFVSLFLSIILAIFLARTISNPILKLYKKVREISHGEWLSEPVPSRIREIDDLAVEIYGMKTTIQSTIETLNSEIAERKQTEAFLQDIIDNNPISIQIVDKDGYTVMVNDANARLFGATPPPEFNVFNDFQILEQGQSDLLVRAQKGEVVYLPDMHYNVHRFNPELPDKPIWVKVVIFPIKDKNGIPVRFVLMHEDVTGRKAVEAALIAARDSAEENNRLKSSFLANMSHELRTPLSGILGFSELLKEHLTDKSNKKMADMIFKSGNRLLNTLNLIIDLSQIEANMQKVTNSTFDINLLIKNTITLFKPVADKKKLELNFVTDIPTIYVNSDYSMFEHILNELVNNAIKYTEVGGIEITAVSNHTKSEAGLIIAVSDSGIGIPSTEQETIFDAFRQVSEGWNRSFEGTGLGLTICKKYVALLGGKITLNSKIGEGSVFTLTFPLEILQVNQSIIREFESQPAKAKTIPAKGAKTKHSILLVDDDEMCKVLVTSILNDIAEVYYSESGEKSLELMRERIFDAVLLDINLKKGMSGLDVIEKIQRMDAYKHIPVIALTAYAMLDDKAKFISLGFKGYLSKPFTSLELIQIIENSVRD